MRLDIGLIVLLRFWSEPVAHCVFRNRAWIGEIQEIVLSARFGSDPTHAKSAERLPVHESARDGSINIQIAHAKMLLGKSNVIRIA